jgi:hypothetical protein
MTAPPADGMMEPSATIPSWKHGRPMTRRHQRGGADRATASKEDQMNSKLFKGVTRSLTSAPSRRDILRGLAGTGLGLGIGRWPAPADAKKKRKRKKKAKPNAYGCLEVGDPCKNAGHCCSGICQGKQDKRKCKAHGTGTCDQEGPGLCTAPNPELLLCDNSAECACIRTTAGTKFCYDMRSEAGTDCADCQKDADCETLGFPSGTACAAVSEGRCAGVCAGGMMCMVPCGYEPPVPE